MKVQEMVSAINEWARVFRAAGKPVIFVRFEGPTCRPYDAPDGEEFFEGIEFLPGDTIVDKRHMNSFNDTDLEKVLRDKGCDTAVMAGTVAQYCVISTYYAAFDHDIKAYLAYGALAGTTQKLEDEVEDICKVLTLDRIVRFFEKGE
jgi:nicotinamidase-related amidase